MCYFGAELCHVLLYRPLDLVVITWRVGGRMLSMVVNKGGCKLY